MWIYLNNFISTLFTFYFLSIALSRIIKFSIYLYRIILDMTKENSNFRCVYEENTKRLKKDFGSSGLVENTQIFLLSFFFFLLKFVLYCVLINDSLNFEYLKKDYSCLFYESLNTLHIFVYLFGVFKITLYKLIYLHLKSTAKIRNFLIILEFLCLIFTFILLIFYLIQFFSIIVLNRNFLFFLSAFL